MSIEAWFEVFQDYLTGKRKVMKGDKPIFPVLPSYKNVSETCIHLYPADVCW